VTQVITLVQILIILGLCLDVAAIWFTITRFSMLENLLLIHWNKISAAISLAIIGFSVGFVSEFLELFLPSVYEGFLEQSMNSLELVLMVCGLIIVMYMWLRVKGS